MNNAVMVESKQHHVQGISTPNAALQQLLRRPPVSQPSPETIVSGPPYQSQHLNQQKLMTWSRQMVHS